jgi:hypothetical protein
VAGGTRQEVSVTRRRVRIPRAVPAFRVVGRPGKSAQGDPTGLPGFRARWVMIQRGTKKTTRHLLSPSRTLQ